MYASRKRKVSEQVVPAIASLRPRQHNSQRPSTNPFENANYPIPDFERVYNLMRDPGKGVRLADRRWRLLNYPKCFIGNDAVQWMVDNLSLERQAAVARGQSLMEAGVIHHVTHSEPFSDDYYFYRFQEDDDGNILNMKRVWDSAIPTRHAVDVAKDLLTRLALLCEEYRKRILEANSTPPPPPSNLSLQSGPPSTPILDPTTRTSGSPSLFRSFSSPPLTLPAQSPLLGNPIQRRSAPSTPILAPKHAVGDDVDYSALAKSEQFRKFALSSAELQRVQLVALNHQEQIAFFVNVYNALCLHAHVVHGPPNNVYRRYVFFRFLSYRVAGLDLTLDDIEHGILRGNKRPPMLKFIQQLRPTDPKCQHVLIQREPRIHFIISAGTRSDPPIRILDGDDVQEELHHATVEFLSYTVKVDPERRCITLPRIFYWYAEDFPSPEKMLLLWVAKYLPVETSHQLVSLIESSEALPSISYENFDWSNAEARFNASVVRRKRRRLERECALPGVEVDQSLEIGFQMPMNDLPDPFLSSNSLPGFGGFLQQNGEQIEQERDANMFAPDQPRPMKPESDASIKSQEEESMRKNVEDSSNAHKSSSDLSREEVETKRTPNPESPNEKSTAADTNG